MNNQIQRLLKTSRCSSLRTIRLLAQQSQFKYSGGREEEDDELDMEDQEDELDYDQDRQTNRNRNRNMESNRRDGDNNMYQRGLGFSYCYSIKDVMDLYLKNISRISLNDRVNLFIRLAQIIYKASAISLIKYVRHIDQLLRDLNRDYDQLNPQQAREMLYFLRKMHTRYDKHTFDDTRYVIQYDVKRNIIKKIEEYLFDSQYTLMECQMIASSFSIIGHMNMDLLKLIDENIENPDLQFKSIHLIIGMSEFSNYKTNAYFQKLAGKLLDLQVRNIEQNKPVENEQLLRAVLSFINNRIFSAVQLNKTKGAIVDRLIEQLNSNDDIIMFQESNVINIMKSYSACQYFDDRDAKFIQLITTKVIDNMNDSVSDYFIARFLQMANKIPYSILRDLNLDKISEYLLECLRTQQFSNITYNLQTLILIGVSQTRNRIQNIKEWFNLIQNDDRRLNDVELEVLLRKNMNLNQYADLHYNNNRTDYIHRYLIVRYCNLYHNYGKLELEQQLFDQVVEQMKQGDKQIRSFVRQYNQIQVQKKWDFLYQPVVQVLNRWMIGQETPAGFDRSKIVIKYFLIFVNDRNMSIMIYNLRKKIGTGNQDIETNSEIEQFIYEVMINKVNSRKIGLTLDSAKLRFLLAAFNMGVMNKK